MEATVEKILAANSYFPSHLTHGLLAKHCSVVRDNLNDATAIKFRIGDRVNFPENDSLQRLFNEHDARFNISNYMKDWEIVFIQNDQDQSGYFGVIYCNHKLKQLVLSHGSTDFKISLTRNLLKQSGAHQGIEGVLLGRILLHQGHGFVGTEKAVGLVKNTYENYALSFTGHSLGAWLAELSVFYCHDTFKYKYARAVTFDGPGSKQIMKKIKNGDIDTSRFKIKHLDIVSYVSAPNIVNCTNNHVGKVYQIYPQNLAHNLTQELPEWSRRGNEIIVAALLNSNVTQTIGGHILDLILSAFNPDTGYPIRYSEVIKWPCISLRNSCPETFQFSRNAAILKAALPVGMNWVTEGIGITVAEICKKFNVNDSTLSSLCHLASILWQGEVCCNQFFCVQEYLKLKPELDNLSCIDKFFLQYEAQHKVSDYSDSRPWSKKVMGSHVDECMNKLSKNNLNIQGDELIDVVSLYEYDIQGNYVKIKKDYRAKVTIDHVVDYITKLYYPNLEFRSFVSNIAMERLKSNFVKESVTNTDYELISEHGLNCKLILLEGIPLSYMSQLVKAYAKKYEQEFTTIILNGQSPTDIDKEIEICSRVANLNNNFPVYQNVYNLLLATKQKICFFIEDLQDNVHISKLIDKFFQLTNVRFIVTTSNDNLSVHPDEIKATVKIPPSLEFLERERIRESLQILLHASNFVLSNPLIKFSVINVLTFLKSGKLSLEELVACLADSQLEKEDVKKLLFDLRSKSYLTIDSRHKVRINSLVQNEAQKFIECETAVEFLKLIFLFSYSNILIDYIFFKFLEYDTEKIKEISFESLNVQDDKRKCNIKSIVKCILKEIETSKMSSEIVKTLEVVFKALQEFADKELQLRMASVAEKWSQAQKNDIDKREFLQDENNQHDIMCFLQMFNNFGRWVKDDGSEMKELPEDIDHLLFIGPTGSAKSTAINAMIGNRLICKEAGDSFENAELEAIATGGNKVAEIGNKNKSQTNKISSYFNEVEKLLCWDFPGFLDSHGEMQRIENAFGMQHFTEMVSQAKIVLVVGIGIFSDRGDAFKNVMEILANLCPVDNLQSNLTLLVTKYDPISGEAHRSKCKQRIIKKCKSILEDNAFLRIFGDSEFEKKLAVISRIEDEGIVDDSLFQDLKSVLKSVSSAKVSFEMNVDNKTGTTVSYIGNLLNSYAVTIFENAAKSKSSKVNLAIRNPNFTKDKLLAIQKFSTCNGNLSAFVNQFATDSPNQNSVSILNNIIETLNCFHHIVFTVSPIMSEWEEPLIKFNEQYDYLIREAVQKPMKDGLIRIEAPILSASDISKINLPGVTIIEAVSYLFISDKDLELPGITLSISCKELRIINNRKVSLKSVDSGGNRNSGSFYGYTEKVLEGSGKIEFILDGLAGQDGKNCTSNGLINLDMLKEDIENLSTGLKCIDKLKSYKKDTLADRVLKLEAEERAYEGNLEGIARSIDEIERKFYDPISSITPTQDELTETRKKLADQQEIQRLDLKNVQQKLELFRTLKNLAKLYADYEETLITTEGNELTSIEVDNNNLIMSEINFVISQIKDIDSIFNTGEEIDLDKQPYLQMQGVLQKIKLLSEKLVDITKKHECKDLKRQEHCNAVKNKIFEPYLVIVSDFELRLSAFDYHDIVSNDKSEVEKVHTALLKELKDKNEKLKKLVSIFDEKLLAFDKQRLRLKECELRRDVAMAEANRRNFETPFSGEFIEIKERIGKIISSSKSKDQALRKWQLVLANSDVIFPRSKKTVSARPEFFGNIMDTAFGEHCERQKKKLEVKKARAKSIASLTKYLTLKAKLELVDVMEACDDLVKMTKLNLAEFNSTADRISLAKEFGKVCMELRKWSSFEDLSTFWKWFSTDNDSLISYVNEECLVQEELDKKLEITKEFPESFSGALDEVKQAKKKHQLAKKDFTDWLKNQGDFEEENVRDLVDAYKKFIECEDNFENVINETGKFSSELLLNELNFVGRKERYMCDRGLGSQIGNILRSISTFNKQFYEKYEISGSKGTTGGNSGAFSFEIENAFKKVSQNVGDGGEHAFILEGVYINEYSFAIFRGYTDVGGVVNDPSNIAIGVVPTLIYNLSDDTVALFSTQAATKGLAGYLSIVPTVAGMLVSPIIATYNVGWISGPCIKYPGYAPRGNAQQIDSALAEKCQENCKNYIQSLSQKMLPFFKLDS